MVLRANKRFKDGKEHRYWSVVENRRVAGGRSVQKTLLYLGEINDSDRAGWTRAIEAVDDREGTRQIHLFPEDRTPDPLLEHPTLKLRLDHIELARPRQWGGCWLALELWNRLDLCPTPKKARPGSRSSKPSPPIDCWNPAASGNSTTPGSTAAPWQICSTTTSGSPPKTPSTAATTVC